MTSKLDFRMAAAHLDSKLRLTGRGRRLALERRMIEESGLFDEAWYWAQIPQRPESNEAILDYLVFGAPKGLNPNPLFDANWYCSQAGLPNDGSVNALVHFLSEDPQDQLDPSPLLDGGWYRAQHPEIIHSGLDAFSHYVKIGSRLGHFTTALFDPLWYAANNPDVPPGDGFNHFVRCGLRERRNPNPYFSNDWYEATYGAFEQPPFATYLKHGRLQNNDPGPLFDSLGYRSWYARFLEKGQDVLSHYLTIGRDKGFARFDLRVSRVDRMKVAVIAHLYYDDLWSQLAQALLNIPVVFDLYVTIPSDRVERLSRKVLSAFPHAQVITAMSEGRDIGPFFQALAAIANIASYDAICKIHTKKGITEPDVWRYILLQSVLGSPRLVADIMRTFQTNSQVGFVGPKDLYISGPKFIGPNGPNVSSLAEILYPHYDASANWGFFAGSVFWFRPMLLMKLAHYVNQKLSFEMDNSRNDGQIAHALERMIGMIASLEGLEVGLADLEGRRGDDVPIRVGPAKVLTSQVEPADYLARQGETMRGLYPVI